MHKKEYYPSGELEQELYFNQNNEFHRVNGPAHIHYYKSGIVSEEVYFFNNELHRLDGPAYTDHYEDGEIRIEQFYVNDMYLEEFNLYFSNKAAFEYVKKYPEYINEILMIAEHNNWFGPEQISLLKLFR